jgi:hypothetical protein
MQDGSIRLFVETAKDVQIVLWLLEAAKYPQDKIKIQTIKGVGKLKTFEDNIAFSKTDVRLLKQRTVYVFACHTAQELGKIAADFGSIWWGYSDTIDLIYEKEKLDDIIEIQATLRHIWDRLRIWLPGYEKPEQHPHSSSPSLPW